MDEDFGSNFGSIFGTVGNDTEDAFLGDEPTEALECDYLVIGAGNRGMCFVDGLMCFNKTATIIIVDEHDNPGGQWNDMPSFSKVAQISQAYGCPSRALESGRERKRGEPCERASRAQVLSYYDCVMEDFIRTGRVRFFANCTANWGGTQIESNFGRHWNVTVRNKVVDTTYGLSGVSSSAHHKMPFKVHPSAMVVSPKGLASSGTVHPAYVIIGAGRMGVDTILHLLEKGVPSDRLHWVMPRDYWNINRELLYPESFTKFYLKFEAALLEVRTMKQMYAMLESENVVFRMDPSIFPVGFHACCVTPAEQAKLRRLKNVIRMGYVREIAEAHLVLDEGTYPIDKGALHIDCTSDAIRNAPPAVPIWSNNRITMQMTAEAACGYGELNTAMSAVIIGYVEGTNQNPDVNNDRCHGVRYPDTIYDWERMHYEHYCNVDTLLQDKKVQWKLLRTRPSNLAMLTGEELAHFSNLRDKRIKRTFPTRRELSFALAAAAKILSDEEKRGPASPPPTKLSMVRPSVSVANACTQTGQDEEQ